LAIQSSSRRRPGSSGVKQTKACPRKADRTSPEPYVSGLRRNNDRKAISPKSVIPAKAGIQWR
jgi:hypothetical protein